ncbi:hypothetical protein BDR06DRAFT_562755 [Suillus hirtellus]|nr:hypothetical protein BDR06DRAFT_562755 [Suillus hirtellus]
MTMVSDDPAWWPTINANRSLSYYFVAVFVGVTYDWALTFGQEVELIWRQRWSLMTILYLSVRYLGILSAAMNMLLSVPTILLSDTVSLISYNVWNWIVDVAYVMLWVIMVTRLHAMYQQSRKILIFLIVTFLAVSILNGVTTVMTTMQVSGKEFILSGTYQCQIDYPEDILLLMSATWIFGTAWEVLTLCLAIWIAVKHFRELRQHSAGGIIEGCFTVLMKTHVLYFACSVAASSFWLTIDISSIRSMDQFLSTDFIYGFSQILQVVQTCVLGPRLILGVREYHAKLVANADAATGMPSIAFQERVHISTGSGV